jgi:hypothetical protein
VGDDAIGAVYQLNGQEFYQLTFPFVNGGLGATWLFNATIGEWTELTWTNFRNGEVRRHRANIIVSAFSQQIVGDWQNGWLYELAYSQDVPQVGKIVTDAGMPIWGNRRAPSITGESDHRAYFDEVVLGVETGVGLIEPMWLNNYMLDETDFQSQLSSLVADGTLTADQQALLTAIYMATPYVPFATPYPSADIMAQLGFRPWGAGAVLTDGTFLGGPPMIGMAYSDDGGMSYHARLERSLGRAGEYRQVRWTRQGMARDRVYDFTWNHPCVQHLTTSWNTSIEQTPS